MVNDYWWTVCMLCGRETERDREWGGLTFCLISIPKTENVAIQLGWCHSHIRSCSICRLNGFLFRFFYHIELLTGTINTDQVELITKPFTGTPTNPTQHTHHWLECRNIITNLHLKCDTVMDAMAFSMYSANPKQSAILHIILPIFIISIKFN